jgi:membrane fusion protein (multidrug efflux system)
MFQAKLEEAELNLSYATIRSPISGQTSSSKFREGTLIQPGVNGLLTTVYVLDPMWINIAVSDSYFLASQQEIARGELKVPDNFEFEVWLTMADGSEYPFPGTVSFISPVLDPNTGSLSVRGIFPNPDNILKPGQFVRVRAVGAERPNAIVVPQEAVQQGAKGRFVYVVDNDRRAQVRYVDTGSWYETGWIIKSGLKAGDEVIVSGVEKVRDGTRVKPRAGS